MTDSDEEKSQVLGALGMVMYNAGLSGIENVKSYLFKRYAKIPYNLGLA